MAGGTFRHDHPPPASERGSRPGRTDRRGAGTPPGTARSGSWWLERPDLGCLAGPGTRRPPAGKLVREAPSSSARRKPAADGAGRYPGRALRRQRTETRSLFRRIEQPGLTKGLSSHVKQVQPAGTHPMRRVPLRRLPPRRRMAEIWIGRSSLPSPTRKASLKISTTRTRGVPFAAATGLRKESGGREMSIGRAGGHWLAGQLQGFRVGSRVSQIGATQLRSRPIGRRGLPRGSVGGSRTFLPCPPLASRPTEVGLGEGRLSRSRLQHARRLPRAWVRVPCCLTSTPRHPVDPSFRPGPAARPSLSARAESFAPLSLSVRSLAGPFTAETRPGPGPGPGPTGPSPADPTSPPGRLAPVLPGLVPTGGS